MKIAFLQCIMMASVQGYQFSNRFPDLRDDIFTGNISYFTRDEE